MTDPIFAASAQYNDSTDTWLLSYPGTGDSFVLEITPELPSGTFTVICQVLTLPTDPTAEVGLMLLDEDGPLYLTARSGGDGPVPVWLMIEYDDDAHEAVFYRSADGRDWDWVEQVPLERPDIAGLILRYESPQTPVSAQVAHYAVLEGYLLDEVVVTATTMAATQQSPAPSLMSYAEPTLHVVIGSQFGDLDVDVGKSVRWVMYFTDRHFVLDVNLGDTRYYVVNWAKTFPEALHGVTGINYFVRPEDFRKEAFAKAEYAWQFGDEDWVLFVDAHEGFSVDNRSLPDDWAMDPFRSYLYREVQRAVDATKDWACIPFFAFVKHENIANVSYPIGDPSPDNPFIASQPIAVPYYIPDEGLVRLVKVAALRDPDFDWSMLDQPSTPDPGVKIQILSYAYAHWNLQDIVPPATAVEPLSEANDDGWRMRKLISEVRPVDGLPHDIAWNPSADDDGVPGPSADDVSYNPIDIVTPRPPITPDPLCAGITAPIYHQVFRINLRDGVWYEGEDGTGALGNVPLEWDEDTQTWVASFPPEAWVPENFEQVPQ